MLLRTLAGALACALLTPTASADRFYLGSEAEDAKMVNGGTFIEGVLLRAVNGSYVVRVEGGEITLARSQVYKIEKDGLTVEDLERREKARAQQLADANTRRVEAQAVEASAQREAREARAAAPDISTKRLPESLAAVSKSMPGLTPSISKCSFGWNENSGGVPQLCSSRLSSSSAPSGTSS